MKVSNVSIFKDVTVVEAIHLAIAEMFNKRASSEFMACLVIDEDGVGVCEQVQEYPTCEPFKTTSYFITSCMGLFTRVEHCTTVG
tara:strand:+ start:233 stop:487 length:255 start_codon:yes stop_codon:yes gene_type:complete